MIENYILFIFNEIKIFYILTNIENREYIEESI